jgi:hypothetical protein
MECREVQRNDAALMKYAGWPSGSQSLSEGGSRKSWSGS